MNSALLNRSDASQVLALLRELEPDSPLAPQWRELTCSATHQDVARVVLGHQDEIYSVAFSPDSARVRIDNLKALTVDSVAALMAADKTKI